MKDDDKLPDAYLLCGEIDCINQELANLCCLVETLQQEIDKIKRESEENPKQETIKKRSSEMECLMEALKKTKR
jgi:hypothetical protein